MFRLEKTKIVKSKIVCTIGPATNSEENLKKLVELGCDLMRLNFSHASKDEQVMIDLFNRIRKCCPETAILCDIQGPKIRIGMLQDRVYLKTGEKFRIHINEMVGNEKECSISYKGFINDIKKGSFIFINDGLVRLQALEINKEKGYADFEVTAGGEISSKKGVNIPEGELSTRNPTEKDIKDLKLIAKLYPEYVAASFVANAREVREIRAILANGGASNVKIISKIERPVALKNFDEILKESDGIMVARGDLGVEIPAEDVPRWQKMMIKKCNQAGKPVIVATQMLESMIQNPVPTRAEVNDIYNAINDRSDAVMLSGETSVGKYWQEAVSYMSTIAAKAEKFIPEQDPDAFDSDDQEVFETAGHAIYTITKEFIAIGYRAKCVVFTRSGRTARLIAKYRPKFPILAISNDIQVVRQLKLVWGVIPIHLNMDMDKDIESIIKEGIKQLVEFGFLGRTEYAIVSLPSRLAETRNPVIGLYYPEDLLVNIEIQQKQYKIEG